MSDEQELWVFDDDILPLIEVSKDPDDRFIVYRINPNDMTGHQFVLLLCDVLRQGAKFFSATADEFFDKFVAEYANPEVDPNTRRFITGKSNDDPKLAMTMAIAAFQAIRSDA